ncbi:gliding motility-associated C-terminal domain-containing protein [Xanthovirga aplysinae]|uniref:T9SS type B sorting domain-containing protein n=1 Tax=Xanthovirga aplysinae TaxID=2529853 RepID=UPI003CCCA297
MVRNRNGKVVANFLDYNNDWTADGVPDGIYYYILRLKGKEEKAFKGWVEIWR